MDGIFYGFAVLLFAAIILMVEGAYLWWADTYGNGAQRVARRLRMMSDQHRGNGERISILKQRRYSKSDGLDELLHKLPGSAGIDGLLLQAGVKWTVAQFLAASAGLLVIGLLMTQIWPAPFLAHCVIVACCASIPMALARRARRARLQKIEAQLPETADFLARAMLAGHSFNNVLQMVGSELPEPLSGEFRIVHEEINYGVPMHEALTSLASRIPLTDLRYLVIAVLIQREAGGNLAEILGNISHIIRGRLKLLAQVRVLSAEGRMSAWVLGLLPFAVALVMMLTNPGYISMLWTDPAGVRMLWYAAVMLLVGIVWLRRLIRIRI
ncbi:type II secretion system F family protein [Massilia sp. R2A-15]|uniref:type II secretion system F family protein n=1 Tax=Massilia sp. R2A-15 TaxID=3064278 RepID=UPI002733CA3D|nr:type II secretion system F family protein [Massilia sp. R2A-15]WLI89211.1 type II secretion system F family protein [Massilia sp. R2A-15]